MNEKGEKTSIIQNDVHSFSVTGIEIRRVKFLDCAIQAPIYLRHSEVSFLNCSLHGGTFFSYGTSSIDVQKSHIKLSLSCFDQSHFVMKESQYGPELFANGLTFYDSSTGLLQKNHLCTHGTAHNLNLCQIHDHAKVHILQNLISSAKAGILMTGNAQAEIVENKIYITVIGIYAEKNARFVLSKNEIYQNVEYGISIPENLAISLEDNIFRENGKGDIERRKDK